jgi:uncharacterized membrane protein
LDDNSGTDEDSDKDGMRKRLGRRVVLIFIPVIAALLFISLLFLFLEYHVFGIMMGVMVGYTISPFGPEIVIPAGILALQAEGLYSLTYLVIFAVVFVDVVLALFVLLNFEIITAIPLVGKWVKKSEEVFSKKLKKGREKLALSALALYVALPFQGSGGFVGSIMGRMVGLNKFKVFFAIILGSLLGAVPIGIAAHYGLAAFLSAIEAGEDLYKIIGILIIIIFIIVVAYIIRRERTKKRNAREAKENAKQDITKEKDEMLDEKKDTEEVR